MSKDKDSGPGCPVPEFGHKHILLAHGGGGRLMHQLLKDVFLPAFDNPILNEGLDGAIIEKQAGRLAFSVDSYVVDPLFFPGGNIGTLAINGTVNDLAMCGARPLYLSAGFIIEEGFLIDTLSEVVSFMRRAADEAGVKIITGDTKVINKGKGSELFISTTGIGVIEHDLHISPKNLLPGDAIIINEDIGRHGIAVLAKRENLGFGTAIESDCAQLASTVMDLINSGINIHCLHDLTRGGLATALVEIAEISGRHIEISESAVPISEGVHSACEILGIDPFYVANEGGFIIFIPEKEAERTLYILRTKNNWSKAAIIGRVTEKISGVATRRGILGAQHLIDMFSGEQLPRIC